jgi:hypothetical protein
MITTLRKWLQARWPMLLRAPSACALMLLLSLAPGRIAAPLAKQADTIIWSSPENLSNSTQNSEYPAIVTDSFGYVHVFWSEDIEGDPFDSKNPRPGNSIVYSRWDGVSWTPPTDILFVPGESIARFVAVAIDGNNILHAVWSGQSNFYYSSAPSWQADSARAWSEPAVVATDSARSSWESDIAADASGGLHLVYATRGDAPGIYYTHSQDGGGTWELPARLSAPFDPLETNFANVQIVVDGAGRLHVVWQTVQQEGYGQAIYYARSIDGGESWSEPLQLGYRDPGDYEASYPYLASISESELNLIYLDGPHQGRSQRISTDGGNTWSQPHSILSEMEGVNGYNTLLEDGSDQMYLIVNMRTRADQVVGVYYARWLGGVWSPVMPVDIAESASSAHYTTAAVRLGNEVHVVWTLLSTGEIWHIRGLLPAERQTTPLAIPTLQLPTSSPLPQGATSTALPVTTPVAQLVSTADFSTAPTLNSAATDIPLLFSAGASCLLVTIALLLKRRRS